MKALAIAILMGLAAPAAAQPAPGADDALAWVKLLDAGKFEQSWAAAGEGFHKTVAQPRWVELIASVRASMGDVLTRSVKEVRSTRELPGQPDGDYRLVQFDTAFAKKAHAVETVVMEREGGAWKVDGYFIN
jgi:hypothetical protein